MSTYLKYIVFAVFFNRLNFASAQDLERKKNELYKKINSTLDDTNKVNLYIRLAATINKYQSVEHIEAYKKALELSKRLDHKPGLKRAYSSLIQAFYAKEMFDYALTYCLQYKEYAETIKDPVALAQANHLMGILLSKQGNLTEALNYHQLSNASYLEIGDTISYAKGLVSIAIAYYEKKNYDSSMVFFKKSIDLFDSLKNVAEIANSLLGVSESRLKLKNYQSSLLYAQKAYQAYLSIKLDHGICITELALSQTYLERQKYDSSLHLATTSLSLARKLNLVSVQKDAYTVKTKAFYELKRYDSAYFYSEINRAISDSLAMQQSNYMIDNSLFKYNLLKKETEINLQNSLILERNRQNKLLIIGLILISITLSIAVWAFIQKNKSAKKIAQQKKEIEDKQKEIIDSINYAKRIQQSLLPTIKYIAKKIKSES